MDVLFYNQSLYHTQSGNKIKNAPENETQMHKNNGTTVMCHVKWKADIKTKPNAHMHA